MTVGVLICVLGSMHSVVPRTYSYLAILVWIGGCLVAFRQLWIQYVPNAAGNCGPGIDYLISNDYPMSSIVKTMLTGSGDCAEPSVVPILALCGFLVLMTTTAFHLRQQALS